MSFLTTKNPITILFCAGTAMLGANAHASAQLEVNESVVLAAPPAAVWKLAGNFDGLAGWHPAVASVSVTKGRNNRPGAVREVTTKDGAKIVETLEAYDAGRHSMRYRIENSPLPVSGYVSSFSVKPQGKGSLVVWSSHFERSADAVRAGTEESKVKEIVTGIYRSGFEGLQARIADTRH